MQLKDLMIDSKSTWIDFPGMKGFSVEVVNLSKKELISLRKKCTTQKFDRKLRMATEQLDEELFTSLFTKATIKGWKGLKLAYLESLILVDIGDADLDSELEFNQENSELLVSNSPEFDNWLNEVIYDLDNFRPRRD
jgi:hypothetical protein